MTRFRSINDVLSVADQRVVRLEFANTPDGPLALFAHPCVLGSWSRVLANVLEDAAPSSTSTSNDDHSSRVVQQYSIPIDDPDCTAWEEALSLMYPSVPLFEFNWANGARLLLLADKYDMPCLTAHIKAFLNTPSNAFAADSEAAGPCRLEAQLTDGSVPGMACAFEWLRVTSKCGLEQHAQICINHIVSKQLAIPAGLVSSISAQHADQLLAALQQALQAAQQGEPFAALPEIGATCAACSRQWHRGAPGGSGAAAAAFCMYCGNSVAYKDGHMEVRGTPYMERVFAALDNDNEELFSTEEESSEDEEESSEDDSSEEGEDEEEESEGSGGGDDDD